MKSLWSNKKFLIILLAGFVLGISVMLILFRTQKDAKNSVSCDFNTQSGIVYFQVDSNYELSDIQLNYGYVKLPEFDSSTKTISFNISELEKGKSEFFSFTCKKTNVKEPVVDTVTYEVLRDLSEVLIIRYKPNVDVQLETRHYTY